MYHVASIHQGQAFVTVTNQSKPNAKKIKEVLKLHGNKNPYIVLSNETLTNEQDSSKEAKG